MVYGMPAAVMEAGLSDAVFLVNGAGIGSTYEHGCSSTTGSRSRARADLEPPATPVGTGTVWRARAVCAREARPRYPRLVMRACTASNPDEARELDPNAPWSVSEEIQKPSREAAEQAGAVASINSRARSSSSGRGESARKLSP